MAKVDKVTAAIPERPDIHASHWTAELTTVPGTSASGGGDISRRRHRSQPTFITVQATADLRESFSCFHRHQITVARQRRVNRTLRRRQSGHGDKGA